jgi:predicted acetyltransferase
MPDRRRPLDAGTDVRPVLDDQWPVVAWLWQLFRHDLAVITDALPYADGRYQHGWLDPLPNPGAAGYLAWRPHPNGGEAPVGFAIVDHLRDERRNVLAFWTSPVLRRRGVGRLLALDVLARHPGPWSIAFQQANRAAAVFWRQVATTAFGPVGSGWHEEVRPVPNRPDLPPDHWVLSSP